MAGNVVPRMPRSRRHRCTHRKREERALASRRGLLEVRSSLTQNRIARVLFCIHQGQMVLLHGFIKKTQQTPENVLDLAVKRQKEVEGGKAAK